MPENPSMPVQISPQIVRVTAPNPSPMTFHGTNSYVIGRDRLAIIDPGPDITDHLTALETLIAGRGVDYILVTHSHIDHSPLARRIATRTGAPILAFGDSFAGRSAVMEALAKDPELGGGEGFDAHFAPDQILVDGQKITLDNQGIEAIWTPGHFGNHMCFAYDDHLFSGDHVMGWASSLVSPPDGDLTAFMASCRKLLLRPESVFLPGHGDPVNAPIARLNWLIEHRLRREKQILQSLRHRSATAWDIAGEIYTETPRALLPAAERNVLAHLVDLHTRQLVGCEGTISRRTEFFLI